VRTVSLISSDPPPELGVPVRVFSFPSIPARKAAVREQILGELAARGVLPEDETFRCRLAVDEALTNAVVHGNGSDPAKKVTVELYVDPAAWRLCVRDEGVGFSAADLHSSDDPDALTREHGRGVELIRRYMDEVAYYRGGNTLVMGKKIRGASSPSQGGPLDGKE